MPAPAPEGSLTMKTQYGNIVRKAVLCLWLTSGAVAGAEVKGIWLKDPITGAAVWNSDPRPGEAIGWSGGILDEKASGPGVLTWIEDGRIVGRFAGTMVAGKAEGRGKVDFEIDEGFAHYEGDFSGSRMHGTGVLVLSDGSRAEGDFRNDNLEGFVNFRRPDGTGYTGEVRANLPHGKGRQIRAGGEEYLGDFVNGEREGDGVLLLPNGDIYTGPFKAGRPDGRGKLETVEGGVYEGPFRAGEPHGTGIITTPAGEKATGPMVHGVPDGKFVITAADGTTREETWKNGKQVTP